VSDGTPFRIQASDSAAMPLPASAHAGIASDFSHLGWAAGFFFSFRIILVFICVRWLNAGTEPGVLATFAISAVLLIASMVQAFGGSTQPLGPMWRIPALRWVILYLAFSACSLLWTTAASPAGSALYWCALAADAAIVLLVFRGSGARQAAHSLMKGFICGSCILAVIAWLIPREQDLRLGDLDYFNTNQIGNLCALSIFLCLILASRNDGRWHIPAIFLTITLFRSLSKATLVAFVASQCYRLLIDRGMAGRKKFFLVVFAIVVTLLFWGLIDAYVGIYTTVGNQAETLTGRTAIWIWSLNAALSRPWLGNGIDAMWKVAPPFGGELFEARHAENELLQQFFAYGIAGIAMLVAIYGSLWRRVRGVCNPSERSALLSILVYVIIRGVAEAEPFDLLLPIWLITTIALLLHRDRDPKLSASPLSTVVVSETRMGS
jgi:exopolysaccharide production protein ExoQ